MDELTLRRAQQGDAAAFERLMTPLEGMVWRVCYHYTGHREDASDCAQEAMVKAWRSLSQYRQDCSLETWLYRVCASCCLDFLRRRKPNVSLTSMAEQGFDPPDAAATPEESALRREDGDEVRRAIALLPEDIPEWIEHSDRFHLIFYDYCRNQRLALAAEKLRSQLTIFSNIYETEPQPQRQINQMHSRIWDAYRRKAYAQAGDLMKQHLEDSLLYAKQCLVN